MEKCDIFSLGMIMLKAHCKLTEEEIKKLELNVFAKNPNEVDMKVSKVLKSKEDGYFK